MITYMSYFEMSIIIIILFLSLCRTSIVGYGQVPEDSISMIVIVTIIVGLGIPALLVLVGAVYVVIKKKPWQNVKRVVAKATGTSGGYTKLN